MVRHSDSGLGHRPHHQKVRIISLAQQCLTFEDLHTYNPHLLVMWSVHAL